MDVEKEKNAFQKLIDGSYLFCIARLFSSKRTCFTNQYYLPLHGGILNQYLLLY